MFQPGMERRDQICRAVAKRAAPDKPYCVVRFQVLAGQKTEEGEMEDLTPSSAAVWVTGDGKWDGENYCEG